MARSRPYLVPVSGGESIEISSELLLIGRSRKCDIQLEHDQVSLVHATVMRRGKTVILRDLRSSNGTFVNGKPVVQMVIGPDDRVRFGGHEYLLQWIKRNPSGSDTETPLERPNLFDSCEMRSLFNELMEPNAPDSAFYAGEWEEDMEIFPGCVVSEQLGVGGFSEVWKANKTGFGDIAIKRINLFDAETLRREERALHYLLGLKHPNLIQVFGCRQIDRMLLIALELGTQTWESRFKQCRSEGFRGIPMDELLEHLTKVSQCLDYIYTNRRLLHRDIKPSNLLLVGNTAKVGDFGLAKLMESTMEAHSGVASFDFAPPEFFEGRMMPTSDQFSLAATYCYLLTGHNPFPGSNIRQIALQHVKGVAQLQGIPEGQQATLLRALAKDPVERFPSCSEFVQALCDSPCEAPSSDDSNKMLATFLS